MSETLDVPREAGHAPESLLGERAFLLTTGSLLQPAAPAKQQQADPSPVAPGQKHGGAAHGLRTCHFSHLCQQEAGTHTGKKVKDFALFFKAPLGEPIHKQRSKHLPSLSFPPPAAAGQSLMPASNVYNVLAL